MMLGIESGAETVLGRPLRLEGLTIVPVARVAVTAGGAGSRVVALTASLSPVAVVLVTGDDVRVVALDPRPATPGGPGSPGVEGGAPSGGAGAAPGVPGAEGTPGPTGQGSAGKREYSGGAEPTAPVG